MSKPLATLLLILVLGGVQPASGPALAPLPAMAGDQARETPPEPPAARVKQNLEHALAWVHPILQRYGYPVVFLSIMVEGMGIIAPGQTLLMAAALAAAHGDLNIVWVILCALAAAVLGNTLGYFIGLWGGRRLLARFKVRGERLARLEGYFARYGQGVVLIARFFDGLRQLNGIVAGMLKMPWKVFTTVNVLGAVLWTGAWGLGAYFLGKEIHPYHVAFRQIEPWVAALSLLAFLALLVYLFHRHRTGKSG
jgi:membrane protein DedA with SNARE-associated domain